jgi:hypothetical protein
MAYFTESETMMNWILKYYWKMENVTEVQKRWRNEFGAGGEHFEHL